MTAANASARLAASSVGQDALAAVEKRFQAVEDLIRQVETRAADEPATATERHVGRVAAFLQVSRPHQ
jgi:hypothetical protein